MTEVFTAGAVLDLVDNVTPKLGLLGQEFGKFDLRIGRTQELLDKLSLQVAVTKIRAEFAEIGGMGDAAAANIAGSFDKLAVSTAPAFVDIEKKAQTAFGAMSEAAKQGFISVVGTTAHMSQVVGDEFAALEGKAAGVFAPMAESARTASAAAIADIEAVNAAIEGSLARVQALGTVASERAAAAPAAGAIPGGGRGASLRHRKGGGGPHFGRVGGEVGGMHVSIAGNGLMVGAGLALDGVYEAAQIDDFVAKALMTSQIPIGPGVSQTDAGKRIHDMIQNASRKTAFNFHDTGEAVLEGQRLLNQMPFKERNDLIEQIMPAAAYEARMKGSTMPEAVEAIIGIAHQTQTYDAAGIAKIANSLAYTSILTPSPLPQFQTALGYSMPELHNGLGMDPSTLMLLTATMQQSGIKGTKSGTWLRSFFENSEPGNEAHNTALQKLGMLDKDNKLTWRVKGADGNVDWAASVGKLSTILQHDQETIPVDERIGLLRKAYGERGAGFASLMMGKKFTENLTSAEAGMGKFKGGEDMLAQYADASILQQSRLALQGFNVAMSDLGTNLMPKATATVKEFSEIMKAFDSEGFKGFAKLFFDKAIKPDVAPLAGPLTKALPKPGDLPDGGVSGLFAPMSYIEGGQSSIETAVERGAWLGVMMGLKNLPGFDGLNLGGGAGGITPASYTGSSFDQGMARASGRASGSGRFASLPTGGAGRGGDDPAMGGRARESWDFWKGKGLTDEATAGLLGMEQGENNFQANSGMFRGWGDGGAAYGSFMWHADRRAKIFAGTGINVIGASHEKQLEAAYWELTKGDERGHMAAIARANSPAAGARAGVFGFERPADKEGASRLRGRYADHWYQQFHGSVPNAAPGVASGKRMAPLQAPQQPVHINVKTHLDGKIVAENSIEHILSANRFTHSHSYHDDHAHYAPPDVAFG